MKHSLTIALLLAAPLLILTTHSCRAASRQSAAPADTTIVAPHDHHLSLLFAGDLMQHGPQIKNIPIAI